MLANLFCLFLNARFKEFGYRDNLQEFIFMVPLCKMKFALFVREIQIRFFELFACTQSLQLPENCSVVRTSIEKSLRQGTYKRSVVEEFKRGVISFSKTSLYLRAMNVEVGPC